MGTRSEDRSYERSMVIMMFVEVEIGKRFPCDVVNVEGVSVFGEDLSRGKGRNLNMCEPLSCIVVNIYGQVLSKAHAKVLCV
jgi:hypothetical protein